MSRAITPHRPELVTEGPAPSRPRWLEMVMSSDHKDVGRIYIGAALSFLVLGIVSFLLIRLQLGVPENDLIEPVTFNRLLSVGSATLVVLFGLPIAFGLYTYVVPLQIGARSLAFPRLASLSVWLYIFGGALLYASFAYTPPEAGFNSWPPLSDTVFISNNGVDVWIAAVGLTVLGLVLQSINLAVTISKLRAPGLAWRRLPAFTFSGAVSSWTMIVAGSAMLAALVMLEMERHFGGIFFDPGEGGAPIFYQHLSWIFFTGCYLVFLLPAFGAISEILPVFSGKPLLSRGALMISMAAIMPLGLLAWMQNMMSASIPIGWLYGAMLMALLLTIPIGVIVVNWIGTIAGGVLRMRAPMVFALAAISTLTFGLVGELIQSVIPVNWLLADTTASTAASGYVLVGGPVLGGLAALYEDDRADDGRSPGETLRRSDRHRRPAHVHPPLPRRRGGPAGGHLQVLRGERRDQRPAPERPQPDRDDRRLRPLAGDHPVARQRLSGDHTRHPRGPRPMGRRDARVVRDLAPSAPQFRRGSGRPQRRAAARHPRRGAPPRGVFA
jgi:cytochrome c oxidase subunit 1